MGRNVVIHEHMGDPAGYAIAYVVDGRFQVTRLTDGVVLGCTTRGHRHRGDAQRRPRRGATAPRARRPDRRLTGHGRRQLPWAGQPPTASRMEPLVAAPVERPRPTPHRQARPRAPRQGRQPLQAPGLRLPVG